MHPNISSNPPQTKIYLQSAFWILLVIVIIRTAWVCDDAYITMRSVDNFVSGYGPVYNVGERVQSYTHPLWFFLLSAVYGLVQNAYFALISVSIVSSAIVIWVVFKHWGNSWQKIVFAGSFFVFSKAFIDYATSGLENPLSHLLVVLFLIQFFQSEKKPGHLTRLFLWAGLAGLNRIDLLAFFLPALVYEAYTTRASLTFKKIAAAAFWGFSPLLIWLFFSLIYYGAPIPNTAFAKLSTGIPKWMLWQQGFGYYLSMLNFDAVTLFVIGLGILSAVLPKNMPKIAVALGIGFYCSYIVYVGGDFMNGRFFTVPFLAAVILLLESPTAVKLPASLIILGITALLGLSAPNPSILSGPNYGQDQNFLDGRGVADERAAYYPSTGLMRYCRGCQLPDHVWVAEAHKLKTGAEEVYAVTSIGFIGYFAGPEKHIIDEFGLVDPLLARMPIPDIHDWRVGHYRRTVSGYLKTLKSGENKIDDPEIAEFYEHLQIVTRGALLAPERLLTILKLNLGYYDHLR